MMQQIANFIVDHDPMMILRRTHDTVHSHHRRYAAHSRRQHRPRHRQGSAAGRRFGAGAGNYPSPGGKAEYDRFQALRGPQAQVWNRLRQSDQRPPLRRTLLPQMARRQETRPQCLRPYPRGVRGEAESTDCGDEGRNCGGEAADGGGGASTAGTGEG